MMNRYAAVLEVWNRKHGYWDVVILGRYKRKSSAIRKVRSIRRDYTRFERRVDSGYVCDLKDGRIARGAEDVDITKSYNVPTVGDLGWTP